jgi:lipopolysaccharide/colanic/teichoic acid biosynthesis glycosyltransferase
MILFFTNNGKPFFFQSRPGKDEKIFKIIKFKTMNDKKDKNGNLLLDKERLTKMGAFIRKMSLDEIPQLLNVIKGDMSLVGPRPLLVNYLPYYTEFERKRHDVKPGITGLSQINGRNQIFWTERMKLDVEYVENCSFCLDLKILFKTIKNVIKRNNVVIIPSSLERVRLDVRRNPENKGKYDDNGYLIK